MKLYSYARSSCAYRVRIGLNLKKIDADVVPVLLLDGAQRDPEYLKLNPQGLVPTLVDGGAVISKSLAILEYLDETRPDPRLLPDDAVGRARVRVLALAVVADLQPLQNLSVLEALTDDFGM